MATDSGNATTVDWRVFDDARPLVDERRAERATWVAEPELVDAYGRDGVVLLPGAFSDWVTSLRHGLDRILDDPRSYAFPCESTRPGEPGRFFDAYCNWQRVPEFLDFVLMSSAASMAAQLMGSATAQLFHEHVFVKEANTTKATPWHQDLPYYCIDGRQTASVYIALDDAPAETAIAFVKGSHRSGHTRPPRRFLDGSDYRSDDPELVPAADPEAGAISRSDIAAGDAYVFDFRTLHGSGADTVRSRRRAFSTRWLGDDVVYRKRTGPTSPPLADLGIEPGERMRPDWFPIVVP